ncbi:MAG: hypothetical protein WDW36_002000 [Sanguina aurantia]
MVLPYLQALRRAGCAPKAKGHGSVVTVKTLSNPAYAQSTLQSGHAAAEPLRAGPCTSLGFRSSSQLTALVAAPAYSPLGFLDGDSDTRAPTSPPLRKGELPSRDSSRSSCSPGSSKESTGAAITAETLQDACSIFGSFLEEHEYWVEEQHVDGTIPAELLGTFFRNGPGLQVDRPGHQRHTFDGDGMLLSMAFKDGKAFFRNRYVRTRGFVDEQVGGGGEAVQGVIEVIEAGALDSTEPSRGWDPTQNTGSPLLVSGSSSKASVDQREADHGKLPLICTRNTFTFSKGSADGGRWFNPLDLKFKNVANTGVIFWAGRLLALWEAGRPHLLDATTLHTTERESNLGGCIGNVLAGHYRVTTEYSQSSPSQLADDSSSSGSGRSSSSTNNSSFREKSKTVSSRHSYNTGSDTTTDHHSSGGSSSNRRGASSGDLNSRGSRGRHVSSLTPTTPGSSSSKRWVTFGTGASLTGCNITFYEFLEDGTRIHATTHPLHGVDLSFVHDMAVTEHYYIVLLGPLHFNVGTFVTRYAIGNCTIADCLEYNEEGNTSKLFLFPRPGRSTTPAGGPAKARILHTKPFYSFHHVNAYETHGGGCVVLDTVAWDHVDLNVNQYTVGEGHYSALHPKLRLQPCTPSSACSPAPQAPPAALRPKLRLQPCTPSSACSPAPQAPPAALHPKLRLQPCAPSSACSPAPQAPPAALHPKLRLQPCTPSSACSPAPPSGPTSWLTAQHKIPPQASNAADSPPPTLKSSQSITLPHHPITPKAYHADSLPPTLEILRMIARTQPPTPRILPPAGGCRSELHRLVCDLSGGGSVSAERVMRRTVEFPGINPLWNGLPHQHSYLVADTVDHELLWGPGQALIKVSTPLLDEQPHLPLHQHDHDSLPRHSPSTPSTSSSSSSRFSSQCTNSHSSSSSGQHIMTSTDSAVHPCSAPGKSANHTAASTQMWVAGPRHFPGEPTFIPRPGSTREDDGWLLSVLHDAGEDLAQVLIFDALDISVGPVATIRLQHRLPAGFHGYFSHEFLGPDPASAEHHVRQPPNLIRQL